ncbi:hypothetical protein ACO9S2_09445 [Nitrospira sp. NS4]|uniref:hypothetical protein n=1 Tax=Nitrospira sp. NS4 TaxID=3414498 RepID=UPI003C2ACA2F
MSIDRPMAVFRCYTAEEEATSGLMHCLKERRYANADRLKPRNHVHKNALIPFLTILKKFFDESLCVQGIEPEIQLREVDGRRRLFLAVPIVVNGKATVFLPDPPLNFSVSNQVQRVSYKKHIEEYVRSQGAKDIDDHLRDMANKRNLVLYAGPKGYPADIEITEKFFTAYCARVMAIVRAYLLIQPHAQRQSYVQDSLDAFLEMLGLLTFKEEV